MRHIFEKIPANIHQQYRWVIEFSDLDGHVATDSHTATYNQNSTVWI